MKKLKRSVILFLLMHFTIAINWNELKMVESYKF